MEKKTEDLLRRPLYLYDLPAEVLNSLTLKTDADSDARRPPEEAREGPEEGATEGSETSVGSQSCSLCSLSFSTLLDQRSHLKSDFHHYNLKQKLRGLKPVSEVEFEKLVGDLDESLSGSDSPYSEDEDEDDASRKETVLSALLKKQATLAERKREEEAEQEDGDWTKKKKRGTGKPPLMWFGSSVLPDNSRFGIYRAIFTNKELEEEDNIIEAIKKRQLAPRPMPKAEKEGAPVTSNAYKGPHIFLCMIGGGHFAAMVVALAPRQTKHGVAGPLNREATVLAHKTFHRYTTRRKQGGSQSANDNAKGAAHSAGSSLRRYNEQALVEDVRELLRDWKALLDTSDLLFIRATGTTNRRTLFGPYEGQVLRLNDPRLRSFPFSTRRATQNELMRSFIELTRLKVQEFDPSAAAAAAREPAVDAATKTSGTTTTPNSKPTKPAPPTLSEEEQASQIHTTQLQAMVRRSKLPALLSYLKANSLSADFRFFPPDAQQNHHAPTCLHMAAAQNAAALVAGLLGRAGADPTVVSHEGKTPFELAGDRATRDAFRVARAELGEAAWDWEAARVPPALQRDEAERRAERERREAESKEEVRRKAEEERLRVEGPKVVIGTSGGSGARRSGGVLGSAPMTAQERREQEARGLTPEQRVKLERERRARAAEERMRRLQGGGGG